MDHELAKAFFGLTIEKAFRLFPKKYFFNK